MPVTGIWTAVYPHMPIP